MTTNNLYSILYYSNSYDKDPKQLGILQCSFEYSFSNTKIYINDELFNYKINDKFELFGLNETINYFIDSNRGSRILNTIIYDRIFINFNSGSALKFQLIDDENHNFKIIKVLC
jgi:hypothetical protein